MEQVTSNDGNLLNWSSLWVVLIVVIATYFKEHGSVLLTQFFDWLKRVASIITDSFLSRFVESKRQKKIQELEMQLKSKEQFIGDLNQLIEEFKTLSSKKTLDITTKVISVGIDIQDQLAQCRNLLKARLITIDVFHNGKFDFRGTSFKNYSTRYESYANHDDSVIKNQQDLALSPIYKLIKTLSENSNPIFISVHDSRDEFNNYVIGMMKMRGFTNCIICPMYYYKTIDSEEITTGLSTSTENKFVLGIIQIYFDSENPFDGQGKDALSVYLTNFAKGVENSYLEIEPSK